MVQLRDAFRQQRLTRDLFLGDRYLRIKHILKLQTEGRLDAALRWTRAPSAVARAHV
jgi:hypothetical protein